MKKLFSEKGEKIICQKGRQEGLEAGKCFQKVPFGQIISSSFHLKQKDSMSKSLFLLRLTKCKITRPLPRPIALCFITRNFWFRLNENMAGME